MRYTIPIEMRKMRNAAMADERKQLADTYRRIRAERPEMARLLFRRAHHATTLMGEWLMSGALDSGRAPFWGEPIPIKFDA